MKNLVYTLLLMLAVFSVHAQEKRITPPEEDNVVVGAIGGTVNVSSLGGATYTIPIQIPDGIAGMQPNLSIVYNSQSGSGLLGWGWNLGGLSAITRVGQTEYHGGMVYGVSLDNNDRFSLDGQRLMVLDGRIYGSNKAEYRTEVDGMNKIVSYKSSNFSGPTSFKVWTADGLIMEYGNAENARIVHEKENGEKVVVIWLLNRVENREGNYMVYNYDLGGHDYRLNNIQYSGHPGSKTTVYGINFHYYSNRIDKESAALGNYVLYQPWLLKDISIYHWSQPLSKYEFVYDENCGLTDSPYFYNRLKEIDYEFEGISLNPTTIDWGRFPEIDNNDIHFQEIDEMYISKVQYDFMGSTSVEGQVKFVGDLNGDGFQDYICAGRPLYGKEQSKMTGDSIDRDDEVHTAFVFINMGHSKSDGNSGEEYFKEVGKFHVNYNLRWIYVCDLDGNGIDEILLVGDLPLVKDSPDGVKGSHIINYDVFKKTESDRITDSDMWKPGEQPRWGAYYEARDDSDFTFSAFGYGNDLIWDGGSVAEFHLTPRKNYSFLVGDFLGKGHCDIIFTYPYKHFRYIHYDEQSQRFHQTESVADWNGLSYTTGDFDGDGKTEVWFDSEFDDDPGVIAKVYIDGNNRISWYPLTHMMDKWNRNFTGDFNGDGHTDFLTYRKDSHDWYVLLFKQDWHSYPVFDVTGQMARYLDTIDPGDLNYTIKGADNLSFFVQVADANGDGKSDVLIRNDEKLAILYGPIVGNGFTRIEEYNSNDIRIRGENACGLCIGNFLAQENVSLLSNERLYSFPQHSIYYSVESITDGMGNQTKIDYDYLIHNPMKTDNIYEMDNPGQDMDFSTYHTPIPIKAVKKLTTKNIHLNEGAVAVESFHYANATIHRKGRGFLGFGSTIHDKWQHSFEEGRDQESRHIRKEVYDYSIKPMGEHPTLLPVLTTTYRYKENGEELRTMKSEYSYRKALCNRDQNSLGIKVYMPLVATTIIDEYELLGERSHLRRRIDENEYNRDHLFGNLTYSTEVQMTESRQGTDSGFPNNVEECEFQSLKQTEYSTMLNSGNLWMPNRPQKVFTRLSRRTEGYADSKTLTVYSYDNSRPYLPKFVTTFPSGEENYNDPLSMTAYYTYYSSGNLKSESHYPTFGRSEDGFKTIYEYSPHYRFITKKIEEYNTSHTNDYVTTFLYDDVYGDLKVTTDYNGYSTYTENPDHLGITIRSYNLDRDANQSRISGTETITALRWLQGSGDEYETHAVDLVDPAYFSWSKSEGATASFTIYDHLGRELRTVSSGLRETGSNVIYQDTQYDEWGRIKMTSEPYFSDCNSEEIKWTIYYYDDFDRINHTDYPPYILDDELIKPYASVVHDGLVTMKEVGAKTNEGVNLKSHTSKTTVNIMGWTECNKEYLDANNTTFNTTTYGYNANGSLAWTMVNNDETTKISIQYDNAGNRKTLVDPDYGTVVSHYNALGQLEWQETPKGDHTTYHYDVMGRQRERLETSNSTGVTETTTWNYSEIAGQKGLLHSITLGDRQTITYQYDAQHYNNLVGKTERLFGADYSTIYSYDDSNFPQRVSSIIYPSGYSVEKGYDNITGALTEISHNNNPLWTTLDANALGQITKYEAGNGVVSIREYNDRHLLSAQQATKGSEKIQDFAYKYDIFGNLAARTENKSASPLEETFTYDYLNRLESVTLNNGTPDLMKYDAHGRFLSKMRDGQTVFENAKYETFDGNGIMKPHAMSEAITNGSPVFLFSPHQTVEYTIFDKVKALHKETMVTEFDYGFNHQRIRMNTSYDFGSITKLYIDNCEQVVDDARQSTYTRTFLSGPMGVFAVAETNDNETKVYYVYKDHLGSWTTITDETGAIRAEQSYDAWGNFRSSSTWSGVNLNRPMFDRGFTGHEHVYGYDLINMNGRMYDPMMSSFLSVDNYVQSPESSQNFNRYAYCLNNPLKYTDPSGELFVADDIAIAMIIGAAIGATSTAITNCINGQPWYSGIAHSAVLGGVSGAFGAFVGGAVGSCLPFGGFYAGTISGTTGGFAGGFVNGLYGARFSGYSMERSCLNGLAYGGIGALSGGIMGGLSRGYADIRNGYDFWNGSKIEEFSYGGIITENVWDNYNTSPQADFNDDILKYKTLQEFNVQERNKGITKITTRTHKGYATTTSGRMFNTETGYEVGGYHRLLDNGNSEIHIASDLVLHGDIVDFQAVVGHELIHAYHHFFIPNCSTVFSERVAYQYTYNTYVLNGQFSKVAMLPIHATMNPQGCFWGPYPAEYIIPSMRHLWF